MIGSRAGSATIDRLVDRFYERMDMWSFGTYWPKVGEGPLPG